MEYTGKRMDMHLHSCFSDGELTPRELVRRVREADIGMMALSDHDTGNGISEALAAGKEFGVSVVPAVEFDTEFPEELHILGYFIDPEEPRIKEGFRVCIERRDERNEKMVDLLYKAGYDIRDAIAQCRGTVTRGNISAALIDGGFVKDFAEGIKLLKPGGIAYVPAIRHSKEHVIELILGAGGIPALAHPCHLKCDVHALVHELTGLGLKGIEAYYGTATPGQISRDVSIAKQYGLFISCGSDFHGVGRGHTDVGSGWQDVEDLARTREMFAKLIG